MNSTLRFIYVLPLLDCPASLSGNRQLHELAKILTKMAEPGGLAAVQFQEIFGGGLVSTCA